MNLNNSCVSIIVRTKNRLDTLFYALETIKNQTYRPLELIIVNDGGEDISPVLDQLQLQDIQLRLIVHETCQGCVRAGNAGLDAASGDFIIFLDDDDWFEPNHISGLVQALEQKYPEFLVAYAGVKYCKSPENSETLHLFNSKFDPVYLMHENSIPIHATLFSRDLLATGCRLDDNFNVFEDWDLWLQFLQHTQFYHVDQISAGYRSGGDSQAGWGMTAEQVAEFRQKILDKWRLKWNGETLDNAFRWARGTWLNDLKQSQLQIARYEAELSNTIAKYETELSNTHAALKSLTHDHQAVLNSSSWRITRGWRYCGEKFKKIASVKKRANAFWVRIKSLGYTVVMAYRVSGSCSELMKKIYRRGKENGIRGIGLRIKFHLNMQLSAQKNSDKYHLILKPPFYPSNEQLEKPSQFKIAVMAHIYYTDLFEEICSYLNHIPFEYTLFLSVTSEHDVAMVKKMAKKTLNTKGHLIVKEVPNCGRDIAPMLVAFGPELKQFDIFCHIHTKKSTHGDTFHFGRQWRRYLLDTLLGSKNKINAVMAQFAADDQVGIIYPETFPGLPYWAHTWLSNRHVAPPLLSRMGISNIDYNLYIDFPAGSMFWARVGAITPLLDLNLRYDDFPEESGQTDNTLQHVIERCLVFSANSAGLEHRIQYFQDDRHFFISKNPFVINTYCSDQISNRIGAVERMADVISFDIFDTILIRTFATPDALFQMLEKKIKDKIGINGFVQKRKAAENQLRCRLVSGQDVSISDIYQQMEKMYGLSSDICNTMKHMEISGEKLCLRPRMAMIKMAKRLKSSGKRLVLTSDMYLEKKHIQSILEFHGLSFFDEIYVSSEIGLRKDKGDIWKYILDSEKISKKNLLHIGDNEQSDIQFLSDHKFLFPVHIMRPISLLGELRGGRELIHVFRKTPNWRNELLLGLIANRVSGFLDEKPSEFRRVLSHPELFGYTIFGPIVFCFMAWLIKNAISDKVDRFLFLSRDGWLLRNAYEQILHHSSMKNMLGKLPSSCYFYCSRSFVGPASIETLSDAEQLLNSDYNGSLQNLLSERFALDINDIAETRRDENFFKKQVSIPGDRREILNYLDQNISQLKKKSATYRQTLIKYWNMQVDKCEQPALVDIGYTGTMQKSLMKILKQPLSGYYFATNCNSEPILQQGGKMAGCFGSLLSMEQMNTLPVYRYALLLEAVLTSPQGQLKKFKQKNDGRLEPVFKAPGISQRHFTTLEKIQNGCLEFISDVIDVAGSKFYLEDWDMENKPELMALVIQKTLNIDTLSEALVVEDDYCGNDELPVLDFYQSLQKK